MPCRSSFYAATGSPKLEAAAVSGLAQPALERRDVGIGELQLAVAALGGLKGRRRDQAGRTLLGLL